jgi:hypothetical protein
MIFENHVCHCYTLIQGYAAALRDGELTPASHPSLSPWREAGLRACGADVVELIMSDSYPVLAKICELFRHLGSGPQHHCLRIVILQ